MGVLVRPDVYILFISGKGEKAWPWPGGGYCLLMYKYVVLWSTVVYLRSTWHVPLGR